VTANRAAIKRQTPIRSASVDRAIASPAFPHVPPLGGASRFG
jgi:hypothetical protein